MGELIVTGVTALGKAVLAVREEFVDPFHPPQADSFAMAAEIVKLRATIARVRELGMRYMSKRKVDKRAGTITEQILECLEHRTGEAAK